MIPHQCEGERSWFILETPSSFLLLKYSCAESKSVLHLHYTEHDLEILTSVPSVPHSDFTEHVKTSYRPAKPLDN